jgi:hypothetical protein
MNQCNAILNHLQNGNSITQMEALNMFQCFRLASRVNDLRNDGHKIVTEKVKINSGKTIARYFLTT